MNTLYSKKTMLVMVTIVAGIIVLLILLSSDVRPLFSAVTAGRGVHVKKVHPADRKYFTAAYALETADSSESTIERVDGKFLDAGYIGIVRPQSLAAAPDPAGVHPADRKFISGTND